MCIRDRPNPAVFCGGTSESIVLTGITDASNPTFAWSTGSHTSSILVSEPGTYSVSITDESGCIVESSNVVIDIHDPLTIKDYLNNEGYTDLGVPIVIGEEIPLRNINNQKNETIVIEDYAKKHIEIDGEEINIEEAIIDDLLELNETNCSANVQIVDNSSLCSGDFELAIDAITSNCLLYTSPSPRDRTRSRMPSSA